MSSDEKSTPIVQDAKDAVDSIASKPVVQDAKHEAQHAVQDAKDEAKQVADKINSNPIVQDAKSEAKHVADKVSEAARNADPRDLTADSAVNGLKQVDKTILRLNK